MVFSLFRQNPLPPKASNSAMARKRHLNNAPIREGLVDIQFEPTVSMETLQVFASAVKAEFAEQTTVWQQAFGFQVGPDGTAAGQQERSSVGLRLADKERVLIVRTNGFTYSRLPPYQDWHELRASAKLLWDTFLEIVRPETVTRTAVRYINVLPLPMGTEDFSVFLNASPVVPDALPQGLASFLQRVIMVDPEGNRQAIVTQALEDSQPTEGRVNVILDIDAIRPKRLASISEEVWSGLDTLRDFKNDIFFEHITERTAELFE